MSNKDVSHGHSDGVRPDEGSIRELAYRLWEQAGRPDGQHDEFWFSALRQLGVEPPTPKEPADPHPSDEDRANVYNPSPGGDNALEEADKSLAGLRSPKGSVA